MTFVAIEVFMGMHTVGQRTTKAAILALRRLNTAFATSNRAVGAKLGIKDSDLAILDCLNQEGPQTPTELARRTRTHIATMTGILVRLERDGWIERRHTNTDRRSVQIHAIAIHRLTDTYARANERLNRLLGSWDPDRLKTLIDFLTDASSIVTECADHIAQEPVASKTHR